MHYSYFLVKPDGVRFLDEICQTCEQEYEMIKYYAISDFDVIIKKLYHKHYEQKGEKFANSFSAYLYGLKEIFGNESVLILVGDSRRTYEELIQSIFQTKTQIRRIYVNNNIGIVTNCGEWSEYIRFITPSGTERLPRIMDQLGSYRISDINIIHSPDMTKEVTLEELKILLDAEIINDRNLIPYDMIKRMRKYRTVNFQRDMREEGYEGEVQPDISGWIKAKIEENLSGESR